MIRYIFIWSVAIIFGTNTFAQKATVTSEILTAKQVAKVFSSSIREELGINFPIFRVYKNADKTGQYYCVLTESRDSINNTKNAFHNTFNHNIKAINLKFDNGEFTKIWEINDFIIPNLHGEESIWFWTKYVQFSDLDNDGLIDPIITYGNIGNERLWWWAC